MVLGANARDIGAWDHMADLHLVKEGLGYPGSITLFMGCLHPLFRLLCVGGPTRDERRYAIPRNG